MDLPLQDWMLKIEMWLKSMAGEWRGTKATVVDESAALAARLDRFENKLDDLMAEIRQSRRP